MKTHSSIFIIAMIVTLAFNSCCKRRTVPGIDPVIEPIFIGYAATDIDTLIIRKYKANDGYHTLIDTFISDQYCQIQKGYDWAIYIPATGQTDSISNITIRDTTYTFSDCSDQGPQIGPNRITSYKLNSVTSDSLDISYYGTLYSKTINIYR